MIAKGAQFIQNNPQDLRFHQEIIKMFRSEVIIIIEDDDMRSMFLYQREDDSFKQI